MREASDARRAGAAVLVLAGLVLAGGTPVRAQEAAEEVAQEVAQEVADEEAAASTAGPAQAAPPGKVNLGEVEIRGELEKPKIFFILPKAERDADAKQRRIRFYPDILEPLDRDRFEEEARVLYQNGIPAD
jgi:hypothetical protein